MQHLFRKLYNLFPITSHFRISFQIVLVLVMWRKLKTESEDLVHYSNETLTETYVYDKAVACNTQSNSLLTAEFSLTFLLAIIIDFLVITTLWLMMEEF